MARLQMILIHNRGSTRRGIAESAHLVSLEPNIKLEVAEHRRRRRCKEVHHLIRRAMIMSHDSRTLVAR
jgi:hypothetical protein